MKYALLLVLCFSLVPGKYSLHAQFVELTHVEGTRLVAGVDVTAMDNDPWFDSVMYCGREPYNVRAIAPGNFTFTFSLPVPPGCDFGLPL